MSNSFTARSAISNLTPNDAASADLFSGLFGGQPLATSYKVGANGAVGGLDAGYNWQASANWLLGVEADFSFAGLSGQATATSLFSGTPQTLTVAQTTDWYGTVRGRLGWLATPDLLFFGTGGFAYGRVTDSANDTLAAATPPVTTTAAASGFGFICTTGATCFLGTSTAIQTGWTAGGGAEWLLSRYVSLKAEYQFVDLGTQTVRVTALAAPLGAIPSSFNAVFRDEIQSFRVGLNWHL